MSKEREALKLALEALDGLSEPYDVLKAQKSLRQAIAEAEKQEPAAYMYDRARYGPTDLRGQQWLQELSRLKPYTGNGLVRGVTPLYTAPQPPAQRTPLTDEQIKSMWRRGAIFGTNDEKAIAIARAIEAAHGIKENT